MEFKIFIIKILLALVCGGAIGFEREWNRKSAGLRTNILVCIGATIYALLSIELTSEGAGDIARIIGQVVTGIGFLGAGVILHKGVNVQGLTTAATIWCTSAIGCLVGVGFIKEAIASTIIILIVNLVFYKVDLFIKKKAKE